MPNPTPADEFVTAEVLVTVKVRVRATRATALSTAQDLLQQAIRGEVASWAIEGEVVGATLTAVNGVQGAR